MYEETIGRKESILTFCVKSYKKALAPLSLPPPQKNTLPVEISKTINGGMRSARRADTGDTDGAADVPIPIKDTNANNGVPNAANGCGDGQSGGGTAPSDKRGGEGSSQAKARAPRPRLASINPPKKHASVKLKPPAKPRPSAASALRDKEGSGRPDFLNEMELRKR